MDIFLIFLSLSLSLSLPINLSNSFRSIRLGVRHRNVIIATETNRDQIYNEHRDTYLSISS